MIGKFCEFWDFHSLYWNPMQNSRTLGNLFMEKRNPRRVKEKNAVNTGKLTSELCIISLTQFRMIWYDCCILRFSGFDPFKLGSWGENINCIILDEIDIPSFKRMLINYCSRVQRKDQCNPDLNLSPFLILTWLPLFLLLIDCSYFFKIVFHFQKKLFFLLFPKILRLFSILKQSGSLSFKKK